MCSKWVLPVKNLVSSAAHTALMCAKGEAITVQNLLLVEAFAELASLSKQSER